MGSLTGERDLMRQGTAARGRRGDPRVKAMISRFSASLLVASLVVLVAVTRVSAKALPDQDVQAYPQPQHVLDLVDDDGSLDTALINYLFAKQMVERLRNNADVRDLQRKRSYWKQCAFNAVSCFGKRK